jgi:adenylosuccinate lyase
MAVAKAGGDRQEFHEVIREHSLAAWAKLNAGEPNPLIESLCADARIAQYLTSNEARNLLNADAYVGDAPQRARAVAHHAKEQVRNP